MALTQRREIMLRIPGNPKSPFGHDRDFAERKRRSRVRHQPSLEALESRSLLSLTTLTFDDLPAGVGVGKKYDSLGADFKAATVISLGDTLNPQFPPHSGNQVVDDRNGPITVTASAGTDWSEVGGYITGNHSIVMTAYHADGTVVGTKSTPGANYVGAGTGLNPNIKLDIKGTNIAYVEFVGNLTGGADFTLDDFFFQSVPLTDISVDDATTNINDLQNIDIDYSISHNDAPPFSFYAYLSSDDKYDASDILEGELYVSDSSDLSANADGTAMDHSVTMQLAAPANITMDHRFLIIVADPLNEIPETTKSNNSLFVIPIFQPGQFGGFSLSTGQFKLGLAEVAASGPIGERISRGTTEYNSLLVNASTSSNWQQVGTFQSDAAPYTGDDMMVQNTLIDPLNNLVGLIQKAQDQDRFTQNIMSISSAFSESGLHSNNSTHYEGRAIDFSAIPVGSDLGRLAGLALLSGFDWVNDETSPVHLHVSQRGTSPTASAGSLLQALDFGETNGLITDSTLYNKLKSDIQQVINILNVGPPSRTGVRQITTLLGTFIADVKTGTAINQLQRGFRYTTRGSTTLGLLAYNAGKLQDQYRAT